MVLALGYTVSLSLSPSLHLLDSFSFLILATCSAVSRTIVDHHEGRIGVTSELGKGSTFYFELKLQGTDSIDAKDLGPSPQRINNLILGGSSQRSLSDVSSHLLPNHRFNRVLIVDDSKLNRKMLSRQLKEYFIEIVEVRFRTILFPVSFSSILIG
jgi:hypothetical protein